jgi:ribonucleoside-diphosphate reductase alpha chain
VPHTPFASAFPYHIYTGKYAHAGERWFDTALRVPTHVIGALTEVGIPPSRVEALQQEAYGLIAPRLFIPGGRYLANTGREFHQVNNCLLLRAADSREGWADLAYKAAMALMTGAGIGVYYGHLREAGAPIRRTGGVASGPVPLAKKINSDGRAYVSGGNRRSAIWAGLLWSHPDIFEFIRAKDWPQWLREQKDKDPTVDAPLDMTNISVCLDDEFFAAYSNPSDPLHARAHEVYELAVRKMVTTGEPGFSVDTGAQADEKLRNACTEITSADDSDVCNLGSLNIARFDTPAQFGRAVQTAVKFLTAGTVYSHVPYTSADLPPLGSGIGVEAVREKNRRLGLGLMGLHEFLLKRGVKYGTDDAYAVLEPYMAEYRRALEYANEFQASIGLSPSIAATAIAPNGTIGIVGETTPSGDPMFAASYLRDTRESSPNQDIVEQSVVVDPTAKRLVASGIPAAKIEDAYSLAYEPERRLGMQAYLQANVDQAISSTFNLPGPITVEHEQKQFGAALLEYLPRLRGVTCYPDGARGRQPLKAVDLAWALENEGVAIEGVADACTGGACGA